MKALVIATHPDDETLGCGGTLLKHRSQGDDIYWIILTDMKEKDGFQKKVIETRHKEIQKVTKAYGFTETIRCGFSTTKLDTYPMSEVVGKIGETVTKIKPQIIYLPFKSDVHSDHLFAFQAAFSCTKAFRYPSIKKVLMMETPSETEFGPSIAGDAYVPNYFVDITSFIDRKIEIMKMFKSEMHEFPFPRSEKNLRALAAFRGATVGCHAAESFVLLKEIV
jgi:LmbE family N-acetylglucosaminyl deacetylase